MANDKDMSSFTTAMLGFVFLNSIPKALLCRLNDTSSSPAGIGGHDKGLHIPGDIFLTEPGKDTGLFTTRCFFGRRNSLNLSRKDCSIAP